MSPMRSKTNSTKSPPRSTLSSPKAPPAYLGGALFAQEFPALSVTEALGVVVALIVLIFTLGTLLAGRPCR